MIEKPLIRSLLNLTHFKLETLFFLIYSINKSAVHHYQWRNKNLHFMHKSCKGSVFFLARTKNLFSEAQSILMHPVDVLFIVPAFKVFTTDIPVTVFSQQLECIAVVYFTICIRFMTIWYLCYLYVSWKIISLPYAFQYIMSLGKITECKWFRKSLHYPLIF